MATYIRPKFDSAVTKVFNKKYVTKWCLKKKQEKESYKKKEIFSSFIFFISKSR